MSKSKEDILYDWYLWKYMRGIETDKSRIKEEDLKLLEILEETSEEFVKRVVEVVVNK